MDKQRQLENERAYRIALRMRENHLLLSKIYESLVDRDFRYVERDAKIVIMDLRLIIKSMQEDDF